MPKGQKIVDWTPENEAKLFHTIIAVHDIKVDNAKVAKAFGKFYPDPTSSLIGVPSPATQQSHRIQTSRCFAPQ
jgi:hypothetical protein